MPLFAGSGITAVSQMKFPGLRKIKHYFPVSQPKPQLPSFEVRPELDTYIVGLDQTIVDVVASVSDEFLQKYNISAATSASICLTIAEPTNPLCPAT
jgi:hypothetical protein